MGLLAGYAYADDISDKLEQEALAAINAHNAKLDADAAAGDEEIRDSWARQKVYYLMSEYARSGSPVASEVPSSVIVPPASIPPETVSARKRPPHSMAKTGTR